MNSLNRGFIYGSEGIHIEVKPTTVASVKEDVTAGSSSLLLRTEVWQQQLLVPEINEVKLLYSYFEYSPGYVPSS